MEEWAVMAQLRRDLGLLGAVGLGLGSILGTGVFVALALAAGVAGAALPVAVVAGALLATANGLSSAQLAAVHPVAGGTYAYGRRFLSPLAGFVAGVTFLAAKSASAATAALGVAGYLVLATGLPEGLRTPGAIVLALGLTALVDLGVRRSSAVNLVLVAVTLAALGLYVVIGTPDALAGTGVAAPPDGAATADGGGTPLPALAYATALAFVAYTGYGRVATLGEEVRNPRRTIPRAVAVTLGVSAAVYLAVAWVSVRAVGPAAMASAAEGAAAPLAVLAEGFGGPLAAALVATGAVTAMAGVLLNLVLGLSRVAFAMGRDGEAPAVLARLDAGGSTPRVAVWATGAVVAALAATGDVRLTWSFSALTVLLYYALANASALRVGDAERFVPRWVSWAGLAGCVSLAAFVPAGTWGAAALVVAAAVAVRTWRQAASGRPERP